MKAASPVLLAIILLATVYLIRNNAEQFAAISAKLDALKSDMQEVQENLGELKQELQLVLKRDTPND